MEFRAYPTWLLASHPIYTPGTDDELGLDVPVHATYLDELMFCTEISVEVVNVLCFPFNAVCVRLDMGLLASEVLSTLPRPTIALLIPFKRSP